MTPAVIQSVIDPVLAGIESGHDRVFTQFESGYDRVLTRSESGYDFDHKKHGMAEMLTEYLEGIRCGEPASGDGATGELSAGACDAESLAESNGANVGASYHPAILLGECLTDSLLTATLFRERNSY